MTKEEIGRKAIECGENFGTMCASNMTFDCNFSAECAHNCPYTGLDHCDVTYGYEHGFSDGIEEGRKQALDEIKLKWDSRVTDLIKWCKDGRLEGLKHADLIFAEILEQMKEGGENG